MDILADMDDRISSATSGMQSKKVSKLLPHPRVSSHCFYQFEGEEVVKVYSLNCHVPELVDMRSFENLNKTGVILSSLEAEDLEAVVWSIIEATSWMDWSTFTIKSMALKSSHVSRFVQWLCLAGAWYQLLVDKAASTVWVNMVLKRCDAVLVKVKDSISFESFMDLGNFKVSARLIFLSLLLRSPADALERVVEKSSRALHDEEIGKAVATDKPAWKQMKKLHFFSRLVSNSRLSVPRCLLQASPHLLHSRRREVHSRSTDVLGSPSAPSSGL